MIYTLENFVTMYAMETSNDPDNNYESKQRQRNDPYKPKVHYDTDGKKSTIKYPDGKVVSYHGDGRTIARIKYPNGKIECYYHKDGKKSSIKYPDGREEFYREDGRTLDHVKYKDGHIEKFNQYHA